MKIRPLQDRILVKRIDEEDKTKGGIIIPDSAKEKPQEGKVVAVGKGRVAEDGTVRPLDVKKGDLVVSGVTGIRVSPEFRERDRLGFAFMTNDVSTERRVEVSAAKVVTMMTRVASFCSLIQSASSSPVFFGISMSAMTMSGLSRRVNSIPSRPSPAEPTTSISSSSANKADSAVRSIP